ncbi:MAG: hypothetical protein M1827_004192 [Pycnora praestabilis]|nr:MAG: hypothetical protein M1827_004192 [Pycnora praestabilis]
MTATQPSTAAPISVLFVCLGNICRSPMAEGVFRSLTTLTPQIGLIDSCGTGAYHASEPPDARTMTTLEDNEIMGYTHGARKVRVDDFEKFDYVLAMDGQNLRDLRGLRERVVFAKKGKGEGWGGEEGGTEKEKKLGKVMLFGDFGGRKGEEVVDPYYGGGEGFEVAFEQMVRFSKGFLGKVLGQRREGSEKED